MLVIAGSPEDLECDPTGIGDVAASLYWLMVAMQGRQGRGQCQAVPPLLRLLCKCGGKTIACPPPLPLGKVNTDGCGII
ncbi:hypothetical protein E2C01_050179 [Portunus trituberculatus]|uniref:Uncharacterized protein n=1 Tax=Portunus trituberculatus TaxID=210409 RepID=A0A5B7GFS3_PORTR|nr:hypothetical protein [Portunus trituberculatus]